MSPITGAEALGRKRGRPKKPNPEDPWDYLRFPPPHIAEAFRAMALALPYELAVEKEALRRERAAGALRRAGPDGRAAAVIERVKRRRERDAIKLAEWGYVIMNPHLSSSRAADYLLRDGKIEREEHRTARRHIAAIRSRLGQR